MTMRGRVTGLKRPYPIQLDVNSDEDEYISRVAFDNGLSKSYFIRMKLFDAVNMKEALKFYRKKQAGQRGIWNTRKPRKRYSRALNPGKG